MSPQIRESEVAEQWDRNADVWTDQVRNHWDIFREHWNNPAFIEFAGDLSGKTVLDAGCGEGHNTRMFARRGARMTGVDLSPKMIEFARTEELREPLGIRYERASFTDLANFGKDSFDAVVSTMALMDGPDFPGAIREFALVLRPGGTLAYSILHPCFSTKGFGWVRDDSGRAIKFTVADYFNEEVWIDRWKFGHAPNTAQVEQFAIPRFDRTLSDYINPVIAAGLQLEEISEPRAPESACALYPEAFRKFRDHIALFLYVRASKS
ncbi:class I SAM-dependent methyltransferase [Candidatus Binatus sp.]|uniref:class I SAM-dependent methyltransferase n=2 Tax=Candidatus Binatus sp. TaxID=2811406 RepID=UPI003BAEE3F3